MGRKRVVTKEELYAQYRDIAERVQRLYNDAITAIDERESEVNFLRTQDLDRLTAERVGQRGYVEGPLPQSAYELERKLRRH